MNPLETIANQLDNLAKRKAELQAKIKARLLRAERLQQLKDSLNQDITKNELQISAYRYEYRAIDREHYNLSHLPPARIRELLVEAYGEAAANKVMASLRKGESS